MNTASERSITSRGVHFTALWTLMAVIVAVGFWPHQTWENRVVAALLAVVAARGIAATSDAGHLERSRFEDPLLSLGGTLGSLALMRGAGVAPILAATLIGVAGGIGVRRLRGARDYHGAPIYVGAFVGITSPLVVPNFWWVLAAGILAGVVWSVSREAWVGVGGKMGTMALVSTAAVSLVARLVHQGGLGEHALRAHGFVLWAFVVGLVAAPLSFYLSHTLRWGAVLGSAVPTAVFAVAMTRLPVSWQLHGGVLSYLWYGSSFVGMTLPSRLAWPHVSIPLTGLLFTWIALHFGSYFSGLGGTAGFTALLAVFIARGAQSLTRRPRILKG